MTGIPYGFWRLTGRHSTRPTWFGSRLVLTIEEKRPLDGPVTVWERRWRDARWEDFCPGAFWVTWSDEHDGA
jgi:hypothetical protein